MFNFDIKYGKTWPYCLYFVFVPFIYVCYSTAQSPAAALDPLQQAYAGMQHYTGWYLDKLKDLMLHYKTFVIRAKQQ